MNGPIVCGLDDSEPAKGAARAARDLSAQLGLRLVFVRVVEGMPDDTLLSAAAERLQQLKAESAPVDAGAAWRVESGHPADGLVAVAAAEHASLIVVGSHGSRASLLGSISAEVSRRAPCPVVVVPPDAARTLVKTERSASEVVRTAVRPFDNPSTTSMAGGITRFNLGSHPG